MANDFKEFTKSLGLAAGALAVASAGIGLSAAAASTHLGSVLIPVILELSLQMGKKMMEKSHDHLKIAMSSEPLEPKAEAQITLTRK